jgi:Protein of unknown function (DUF2726)
MQSLPWIVALCAVVLLGILAVAWATRLRKSRQTEPLPKEWALAPRPVFSAEERRVYRLLREALPHHIVLSKLPLVRFCQPTNPNTVRYWFDLLGTTHVTFAVCSANGRVLAAVDLDTDRSGHSTRTQQIKHAVLNVCRVRYLRCPVEHLPSVAELQLLVPQGAAAARGPLPAAPAPHIINQVRDTLSSTVATKRAARPALWQDSTVFQDSFFAPDNRSDGFANSDFGDTPSTLPRAANRSAVTPRSAEPSPHDIVGVVVERPRLAAVERR